MSKKRKKKINRKKFSKRKNASIGIIPVLFAIALLALFSQTVSAIPVSAFLVNKNADHQKTKDKMIISEQNIIAKNPEIMIQKTDTKILNKEKIEEVIVGTPNKKETIKVAEDTLDKLKKVLDDMSNVEGAGTSINNKNITYMQILQNPNNLDLNLKYAQQQGKMGNFKQTISTLERLNMLYPDNVEIKLYLLSVLVQVDSPEKANTIIEEMKLRRDLEPEDLETLLEIEEELKDREPSLWNLTADISMGAIFTDNVNSVSKTRLKEESDSVVGFNSAMHDRTLSGGIGISASRPIGEESSFLINASHSLSEQYFEADDDFQSYGLTLALDTVLGNQSLSPYLMLSKSDYQHDADSFSKMYGFGGFFSVGERNSISYGYAYSSSKGNHNETDDTAMETNSVGHSFTFGHDYIFTPIISTSLSLGYSDTDARVDAGNDYETYDVGLGINFAFPWAYIAVSNSIGFNDYKKEDTTVSSNKLRSDYTNTFDVMLTKAVGDIFPGIDPNRSLFINLSYERLFSEGNMLNYDYITDSLSLSFSKSLRLN